MITFYGYAVKKNGRYLGHNQKSGKTQYYKSPSFPFVVSRDGNYAKLEADRHLGEVVKVKLTMEDVKA